MLHLTVLQIWGGPICVALLPSKHGVHMAKHLHLVARTVGPPLVAVVAEWLERRRSVYPISREL